LVVKRLERQFNLPAGFTREDDCLPERTMSSPAVGGVGNGEVADITPMLAEYYSPGDWDQNGAPLEATLAGIGV
jgi:aldehyde:ferredoxin oxidoreductase